MITTSTVFIMVPATIIDPIDDGNRFCTGCVASTLAPYTLSSKPTRVMLNISQIRDTPFHSESTSRQGQHHYHDLPSSSKSALPSSLQPYHLHFFPSCSSSNPVCSHRKVLHWLFFPSKMPCPWIPAQLISSPPPILHPTVALSMAAPLAHSAPNAAALPISVSSLYFFMVFILFQHITYHIFILSIGPQ